MAIDRPNVYSTGSATATDLRLDGARRKLGDNVTVNQFGGQKTISSSAETIGGASSDQFWSGSKATTHITSSNASDVDNRYYVEGIDSSGRKVGELIQLNGTTAVPLANSYAWVNVCQQYQNSNANFGVVSLQTSGAVSRFEIPVLQGNLTCGGIGIPQGHSALITGLTITIYSATQGITDLALLWKNDGLVHAQLYGCQVSHGLDQITLNIPTTFISDWNNGQPTVEGGLFILTGKNVSGGSAVIGWSGNCLITKLY